MITAELIRAIMPRTDGAKLPMFVVGLEKARQQFVGDDPRHVAMWLAQIAHESGELRYTAEIADGSAYEGRADLGNTQPGDGRKYKGRGLMQITGRYNYQQVSDALGIPFVDMPQLMETPEAAAQTAGWVWQSFGCAALMNSTDPCYAVTRKINGGTNGLDQRRAYYAAALRALGVIESAVPTVQPPAPIVASAPIQITPRKTNVGFIGAALPVLLQYLPSLVRLLGGQTEITERNAKAIEVAADVVTKTVGATNIQEAVEKVSTDPSAAQAADAAIQVKWHDLTQLMGGVKAAADIDRQDMDAAAQRIIAIPEDKLRPFYVAMSMQFALTFGTMVGLFVLISKVVEKGGDAPDLPGWATTIIGSLFIAVALEWRSILTFITGTNKDSSAKTAIIAHMRKE